MLFHLEILLSVMMQGKVVSSSNKSAYLNAVGEQISFSIRAETACTRGEAGYFELQNSNGVVECIKLPEVSFTFTPSGGVESSVHNGDPGAVIKIKFDSTISYVDNAASNLSKQNILEMLKIRDSRGVDLARLGGSIGASQVSFSNSNSGNNYYSKSSQWVNLCPWFLYIIVWRFC